MMASAKEDFNRSGPVHLTDVCWECVKYQRCVSASLVQGVYTLELDRQQNRRGPQALAPPWWEFFHFQLCHKLIDDHDSSIIGAIFKFEPPPSNYNHSTKYAPSYIIAFRGTLITLDTVLQDFKSNLRLTLNSLHKSSRFKKAMQEVQNRVATVEDSNVWLAGHSLGSAMAMLVGKNMAKMGIFLKAFLFNPPFIYPPTEEIENEAVKDGIRIAASIMRAGIAVVVQDPQERAESEEQFVDLSPWVPFLFVNNEDQICSEYIGYFDNRNKMKRIGLGWIGRLATKNSLCGLLSSAVGKESKSLHLLPSANLTVNRSPTPNFRRAHGIEQWWRLDLDLKATLYQYK